MGEGLEIKVKPEQLEQIAKNISEMQTHSQNIQQNLNQSMFSIQMQWQGATSQHFYGEYMRSMRLMESYIRNLQVTEKNYGVSLKSFVKLMKNIKRNKMKN